MAAASAALCCSISSLQASSPARAENGRAGLRAAAGRQMLLLSSHRQQCRLGRLNCGGSSLRRAAPSILLLSVVASQAEFAEEETLKFRSDILKQLEQEPSVASVKERLADVCAKVFRELAEDYNGTFPVEPFAKMKAACDEVGLPGGEIAVRAAIGWSRGYLYYDWNQWKSKTQ